eukprot:CAMPEP_0198148326 /NCGR_PEP_ID=MMETSP1443-20131203/40880_1 /TAXON_ID=186043 /ORGANISM="Entomoneis sp., Strain CCMP2396" /LENGTH=301 /DNA_ID=CAMNT_0043812983 /DNA_START=133 /DNA_END=1038 /DNA_ORIENTATION=+
MDASAPRTRLFLLLVVAATILTTSHGFGFSSPILGTATRIIITTPTTSSTAAVHPQNGLSAHQRRMKYSNSWVLLFAGRGNDNNDEDDSDNDVDVNDNNNDNNKNNDSTVVTREIFQRELLKDPVVKRGKNSKNNNNKHLQYKVLDNRDSLPFRVEHVTPDPYTHPDVKKKRFEKAKGKGAAGAAAVNKRRNANAIEDELLGTGTKLSSAVFTGENDSKTMIGEFMLDKHTTSGDLLEIGDIQYKVTRHKCQYKYAGGQKFVMFRKILQVKEVGRLMTEEYLNKQFQTTSSPSDDGVEQIE